MNRVIRVCFAEKCAWRAIYVDVAGRQVFRLVLDPNNGVRPTLSGTLRPLSPLDVLYQHLWPKRQRVHLWRAGFDFRIPMPHVSWRWAYRGSSEGWRLKLYRVSSRFWHRVDGRYGGFGRQA